MKDFIKQRTVLAYFLFVFLIAWPLWIFSGFFFSEYFIVATLLGAWSPSLTAIWFVWLKNGKKDTIRFLKSLLKVKVGWFWICIVLFSIPVIALISVEIYEFISGNVHTYSRPQEIPESIPIVGVIIIGFLSGLFFGGPLAEDIGWRGYIVPEIHQSKSALISSLIVGVVWVVWHLPFYWFEEGLVVVGHFPFVWFSVLTLAWAVLFAWVYFNTDSLIMPVFYHCSINTTLGLFGILNSETGDPNTLLIAINTVLTWLFVGWVVWYYGPDTLRKDGVRFEWNY